MPKRERDGAGFAAAFGAPDPQLDPAYAFDCEMVTAEFPGRASAGFQCVVSVGVVDERLEKILEARIKVPAGCRVTDDSFARANSGLHPDWNKGIDRRAATSLLTRFAATGVFVGWQLDNDLRCLGFERAADQAKDKGGWDPDTRTDSSTPGQRERLSLAHGSRLQHCTQDTVTIFELTDYFRTTRGRKCQLVEAYQFIFGKVLDAHNAAADAQMTMELYNWWIKQGRPERGAIGGGTIQPARNCCIDVKWYKVRHTVPPRANRRHSTRLSTISGHWAMIVPTVASETYVLTETCASRVEGGGPSFLAAKRKNGVPLELCPSDNCAQRDGSRVRQVRSWHSAVHAALPFRS